MSRLPPKLRRYVFQRAGFECEYCRGPQELQSADLEVDHIWPKGKEEKQPLITFALRAENATSTNICKLKQQILKRASGCHYTTRAIKDGMNISSFPEIIP